MNVVESKHLLRGLFKRGERGVLAVKKLLITLAILIGLSSGLKADHVWIVDSLKIVPTAVADVYDITFQFDVTVETVDRFYYELFVVESGCQASEGFNASFTGCTILVGLPLNDTYTRTLASNVNLCSGKTYDAILYTRRRGSCTDGPNGGASGGPNPASCNAAVCNDMTCGCPEDRDDASARGQLVQFPTIGTGDPMNIWDGVPLDSLGDTPSYDVNWAYLRTTLEGDGVPDYEFSVDIDLENCFGNFDQSFTATEADGQNVTENFGGVMATVRCGSPVSVTYNASNNCGDGFPGNTFEVIDNSAGALYGLGTNVVPGPDTINGRYEDLTDAVALGFICEEGRMDLTMKNSACNTVQTTEVNVMYDVGVVYPTSDFATPTMINCSDLVNGQELVLSGTDAQWVSGGINMGNSTTLPITGDVLYDFIWTAEGDLDLFNSAMPDSCSNGTGSVTIDNCVSCGIYDITYAITNDSCNTCNTTTTKSITVVGPVISNVTGDSIGCGLITPVLEFDVFQCDPMTPANATANPYTGRGDTLWTRSDMAPTAFFAPGSAALNVQPGTTVTFTPHFRNNGCSDCNAIGSPVTVTSLGDLVVTCPANLDLGDFNCSNLATIPALPMSEAAAEAAPYNMVIGDDPCGTISVVSTDSAIPDPCTATTQTITRKIVVMDSFDGRKDSCEFTYDIVPFFQSPDITLPAAITIDCNVFPTATTLPYTNGQTNDCASSGMVTSTLTAHPGNCGGTITETWTIPSAANCTRGDIIRTRTITVRPTPAPTVSCPAPMSLTGCDNTVVPAPNTALVTASTTCGVVMVTHVGDTQTGGACAANPLIVTRTYRATNECGVSTDCTQTFTIVDDVAPVVANVADTLVNCTINVQAAFTQWIANNGGGTVTENCSTVIWSTIPAAPVLNTNYVTGPTTIQFVATDGCGLADTMSANFQVRCVDIDKPAPANADNDGNGTVSLNDVLTYTVSTINTGNVNLTAVTVGDPLLMPSSTMCATVAPGDTCKLIGTYMVMQTDVDVGQIVNEAFGKPADIDTVKDDNIVNIQRPGLNLEKRPPVLTGDTDMSGDFSAGDVITYTIVATNTGPITLTDVMITDDSLSTSPMTCAMVPMGDSCVLTGTYTITPADLMVGSIPNTASAVSDQTPTPTMSSVNTPLPTPMFQIQKSTPTLVGDVDMNMDISEGDTLQYIVTVTNTGTANLSNIVISDTKLTPSSITIDTLMMGEMAQLIGTYVVTDIDVMAANVDNKAISTNNQTPPDSAEISQAIKSYDLDLDKMQNTFIDTDMSGDITEGDTLEYIITATNNGTGNLTDVTILDPTLTPDMMICAGITAPGASCVLTGTYVVQASDLGGDIINEAKAVSDQTDTMATTVTVMVNEPSLAISKSNPVLMPANDLDGSGDISVGDILSYTVTATNNGLPPNASNITDVVITDNLISPNTETCTLLMPGQSCVLNGTYEVTAADLAARQIKNVASAVSDQTDMVMDSTLTMLDTPMITLAKSAAMTFLDADMSGDFSEGDSVQFVITATNNGGANLTDVVITDNTITPSSMNCGLLMPGGSCMLTGRYLITQADIDAGMLVNEAIVTSVQSGPDTATTTTALPQPSLTIDKRDPVITTDLDGDGMIDSGDVLTYTIDVVNTSPVANLTDVVVTDPLLSNIMSTGCTFVAPGNTCSYTGTYVATQVDVDSGFIDNKATVVADQLPMPMSDSVTTLIPAMPSIKLVKTASTPTDTNLDALIGAGDMYTYTFTVMNTGNVTITNITIMDDLLGSVPGTIASLAPGQTDASITAMYTITLPDANLGKVVNSAIATGFDPDMNPVPDVSDDGNELVDTPEDMDMDPTNDPTVTLIPANPILGIDKQIPTNIDVDMSGDISEGDTLVYTIEVTNNGNVTLMSVVINDPHITPNSMSCGSLDPGESCSLVGKYLVTRTDVDNLGISNTATATSNLTMPVMDNVNVSLLPTSMSVAKSSPVLTTAGDVDMSLDISAGDTVNYRLVATNTGMANLTDVTISDVLLTPSSLVCPLIMPGDSCVLEGTYVVAQANIDNGFLRNTASFDADQVDIQTAKDSTPLKTPIVNITKFPPVGPPTSGDFDGSQDISVGDTLTYTIVADVPANSANITDLIISDPLLLPTSDTCEIVLPGQQCSLVGTYIVTQLDVDAGMIDNMATATSDQAPTVDDNNRQSVPDPSMTITKFPPVLTAARDVDGSGDISAGDSLSYRVVINNNGTANLTEVTIDDPRITPSTINCGLVMPGDSCVLEGYYVVLPSDLGSTISNTATGSAVQVPDVMASSDADVPAPSFSISKPAPVLTGDNDMSTDISVGDVLTYNVIVTNNGNLMTGGVLTNVVVLDTLLTPQMMTCPMLAPGQTCTLTGTYMVTQDDVDAGEINNFANAISDQVDSIFTSQTQDLPTPGLSLNKSTGVLTGDADGSGDVSNGDTLTYTITATNTGDGVLTDVIINDPLLMPSSNICASVAAGANCTLVGTYVVQQADVDLLKIDNKATANSDQTEMIADSSTLALPNPAYSITKFDPILITDINNNDLIDGGDVVQYSIVVRNTGSANLTDIIVSDPQLTPNTQTCTIIAPGGTCVLVGNYTVPLDSVNGGTITNMASVMSDQLPMIKDTNVYDIEQLSKLQLTKLSSGLTDTNMDGLTGAGDTITFTFVVENVGNTTVTSIDVTDPLLGGLVGTIPTLDPEMIDMSITKGYTVTQMDVDTGFVRNSAITAGDDPNGDPVMDVSDDGDETLDTPNDPDGDPTNDPTNTPIIQSPASTVVKSNAVLTDVDLNTEISAGDTLTYRVVLTNTGNITLKTVNVTDPLLTPNLITCASIAPRDSCVLEGYLIVSDANVTAGQVVNVGAGESEMTPSIDDMVTTPINTPMISINKATPVRVFDIDNSGDNSVGDSIEYTITATNNGTAILSNIVITDGLITPNTITCPLLMPMQSCVLVGRYRIDQSDVAAGSIVNTATVTTNQTDPVMDDIELDLPQPTITLVKSDPVIVFEVDNSGDFSVGDTIEYTITASNNGTAALTNVVISDPLITPNTQTCPSIAPMTTCVLTGRYGITAADVANGEIINGALLVTDQTDDLRDSVTTPIPQPSLSISKLSPAFTLDIDNNQSLSEGDELTYTIIVTNSGTATLTNVTVNDTRITPSSLVIPSLAPGASDSLIGIYTVVAADMGTTIANTATADADQVDPVQDSTSVGIPFVDLEIDKSSPVLTLDNDGSEDFSVGDIITYTVTVTNTADPMVGGGNLSNVVIRDPSLNPDSTVCDLLLFMEQCVLTGTYELTAADVAAGFVKNTASVTTNQAIAEMFDSTTQLLPQPSMNLVKYQPVLTGDNDQSQDISNGDELTYRVVVYNTGTATLTDVTINDDLITPSLRFCPMLLPMDSCVLEGTYIVEPGDIARGTLSNKAMATTVQTPPQMDSVGIVIPQPSMDVDKEVPTLRVDADGSQDVSVGDVLQYRIKATNTGTANLSLVVIGDAITIPAQIDCSLIMPGDSCVLIADHIVTQEEVDAGMILNTGTVTTAQLPPEIDQEVILLPTPEHETTKRVVNIEDLDMSGNVSTGDRVNYEVTLTNIGQANLTNGEITDDLITPSSSLCPLLMPLQSCNLLGSYVLTLEDVNRGMIDNMALTTTKQSPDDSTMISTDIPEDPSMTITKIAAPLVDGNGDGVIGVGDTIFYTFEVTNTGNVSINVIGITDPKINGPVGAVGRLDPGQSDNSLTGSYAIQQVDIDNGGFENSAIGEGTTDQGTPVTDVSDDGNEMDDSDRDPDSDPTNDPTFVRIEPDPRISLTKEVEDVVYEDNGDATFTFKVTYQNTGNTILTNPLITDVFTFLPDANPIDQQITVKAVNIDAQSVDTTTVVNAVVKRTKEVTQKDGGDDHSHTPQTAALVAGFNGITDTLAFADLTAKLNPRESFEVLISVEVNPDVIIQIFENGDTVFNQAIGEGSPINSNGDPLIDPETNLVVPNPRDLSDDGVDPLSDNDRNDMEDPTIVLLPRVGMTKELGNEIIPSAMEDFFDVDFLITVRNTGSATLNNVCLTENFVGLFAEDFGGVPKAAEIVSSSAAVDPVINSNFDGDSDIEVTDCSTGVLNPGDSIVFRVFGSLAPGVGGKMNLADVAGEGDLRNDNTAIVVAQDSTGFGECADDLSCPAVINASLDPLTCCFSMTKDLLGPQYDNILVAFQLYDEGGNYRGNKLTRDDVGKPFQYRVYDFCSGNFCWGTLNLELKLIPDPIALDPIALMCGDNRPRRDLLTLALANDTISGGCYPDMIDMQLRIDTLSADPNPKCGATVINRVVTAKFRVEDKLIAGDILTQEITITPITPDMIRGPIGSGLSGFVRDSVLILDCEDDIEPPSIAAKYGIPSAYPYVLKDSIMRDTILSRIVEVRDTVAKRFKVDDLWVTFDVIEKRDSTVYDTMTLKSPQYIAITDPTICNWSVKKDDEFYAGCLGPKTKVQRTWSLLDWCKGSSGEIVQWINITDTKGPDIEDVVQYTVPISPWVCAAELELPDLIKKAGCSEAKTQWKGTAGIIRGNKITGMRLEDSPIRVTGIVTSECGVEKQEEFIINIIDASPPVVVAADRLNVSVNTDFTSTGETSENVAKIKVESIDLGSHDSQCSEVTSCILRKEDYEAGPVILADGSALVINDELAYNAVNGCYYDVYKEEILDKKTGLTQIVEHKYVTCGMDVKYCCTDVGGDNAIVLEVTDEAGLKAIGWTVINVEDKPVTECVNRRFVVQCDDDISVEKLGTIPVRSTSCFAPEVEWSDAPDIDACGNGVVIRTWTINGELSCIDEIIYETTPRFDPNQIKWPLHHTGERVDAVQRECVYDEDLKANIIVESGGFIDLLPTMTCDVAAIQGAPTWCDTTCVLIEMSYEDFDVATDQSCGKIIRRWTIIDWCTYQANENNVPDDANDSEDRFEAVDDTWLAGTECKDCEKRTSPDALKYYRYDRVDIDGYYTYDQVVKVEDDTKPVIVVAAADTVSIIDGALSKSDDFDNCYSSKIIGAIASDSCGGFSVVTNLSWWVEIIDEKTKETLDSRALSGPEVSISSGNGQPGDVHTIRWIVSDGCGNSSVASTKVYFVDDKNPTPVCIRSITTTAMSQTGEVTIWASDFDLGSYDNCSDVKVFFKDSLGEPVSSISFNCDTWTSQNGQTSIEELKLWVEDASGNQDFCIARLRIQDNADVCPDNGEASAFIAGQIRTEDNDMIEETQVVLNRSKNVITGLDGAYMFSANTMYDDYAVTSVKEDSYLNGVTSLDLVLMQRHILGISTLNSPYKVIAADINSDKQVSSIDIIQLQKLLLGLYDELPDNTSWRFVDAHQSFSNPMNPWPFTEELLIEGLDRDMVDEDFIGVKIGDLNGNAKASSVKRAIEVPMGTLAMTVEDRILIKDEIANIDFRVENRFALEALQLTLEHEGLSVIEIISNDLEMSADNVGLIDNDMSTIVWAEEAALDVIGTVFTLVVKADVDNVKLSETLKLSSKITSPMAYDRQDQSWDLEVKFDDIVIGEEEFFLSQNNPNPFKSETSIEYFIPKAGEVEFRILDMSGRVITEIVQQQEAGWNTLSLSNKELKVSSGVYYYELESGPHQAKRKMIIVD